MPGLKINLSTSNRFALNMLFKPNKDYNAYFINLL
jgi:hypothetical protein